MARGRVSGFRDPLSRSTDSRLDGLLNEPQSPHTQGQVEELAADVVLPAAFVHRVWPRLSSAAQSVLLPLVQLSVSHDGRAFRATVRQLQIRAGASRPKVQRGLAELRARNVLSITESKLGDSDGHLYEIQDPTSHRP